MTSKPPSTPGIARSTPRSLAISPRGFTALLCLLLGGLLISSCASPVPLPEDLSRGTLPGGFLGYGGEDHEYWRDWTPRHPAPLALRTTSAPPRVFDAWEIRDPAARDSFWDTTFHVLTTLQPTLSEEQQTAIDLTRTRLGDALFSSTARLEIAFFTREDASGEGIVLRIVEPTGTGIWLEAERPSGTAPLPTTWTLRIEPAFHEASGIAIFWQDLPDSPTAYVAPSAEHDPDPALPEIPPPFPPDLNGWAPLLDLLNDTLWTTLTGRNYVAPPFPTTEPDPQSPLAPGWPATLGLEVTPRSLSDFLPHSVFLPRS